MKLYLIRHGETVDNVAGLYAGTRDSNLTNHGVEQTQRLGEHFARNNVKFTHIFSSPLSRAFKTAQAILNAQSQAPNTEHQSLPSGLEIIKVQELIERDFGYYEGKPFSIRPGSKSYQGEGHNEEHKSEPGFVDVESSESMATRIDIFLNQQLLPLFRSEQQDTESAIAIVSHGMLLSHFWRRLLLLLPSKSLNIAPEITAARGNVVLEHLGGWSNTGYLELAITKDRFPETRSKDTADVPAQPPMSTDVNTLPTPVPQNMSSEDAEV